jgi:hypothetical protein
MESTITVPGEVALRPTIDEILAPIRQGFAESGMTEEELDHFFTEAREEAWQERRARQQEI